MLYTEMFLLHIQAETVPMANISHKTMPRSLWDVSFTHPGSNGAYRNSSHKPVPRMLSTGCFSYTSRLKWCLQKLLPQTSAQYAVYRMFLLHIKAEMVATANISHKPVPSTLSGGCFSYTSRLKWWLQELLSQTSAQYAIYRMFLLHIQAEMMPTANISHKTMPRTLWDVCLTHPG